MQDPSPECSVPISISIRTRERKNTGHVTDVPLQTLYAILPEREASGRHAHAKHGNEIKASCKTETMGDSAIQPDSQRTNPLTDF